MFGWFKKQPEQPKPGETEGYQMGQQASQAMTAAVDDYMTARFEPVFKNYLGVFNDCLDRVYGDHAPPIIIARVEFKDFRENVSGLRTKMLDEINVAMREWIDLGETIGSRDLLDRYIVNVVDEYQTRLTNHQRRILCLMLQAKNRMSHAFSRAKAAIQKAAPWKQQQAGAGFHCCPER